MLGFSKAGVRDITRRYTQRMADLLPRWVLQIASRACTALQQSCT